MEKPTTIKVEYLETEAVEETQVDVDNNDCRCFPQTFDQ